MEHIEVAVRYSDYHRISLFIEAVVDWYVRNLDEEYKNYIRENTLIDEYGDTLCLHIRNEFLYPQKYIINQEIEKNKTDGKDISELLIDKIYVDDMFSNADLYSEKIFNSIIQKLSF